MLSECEIFKIKSELLLVGENVSFPVGAGDYVEGVVVNHNLETGSMIIENEDGKFSGFDWGVLLPEDD